MNRKTEIKMIKDAQTHLGNMWELWNQSLADKNHDRAMVHKMFCDQARTHMDILTIEFDRNEKVPAPPKFTPPEPPALTREDVQATTQKATQKTTQKEDETDQQGLY